MEEAENLFRTVDADPFDRTFNSARLWLVRALFDEEPFRALKVLRSRGVSDGFSHEHQAWFYLRLGDAARAEKQLGPLLDRDDHRTGKNLSNFLYGTSLILRRREDEAMDVFGHLESTPWARTWTFGSHYARDRLGDGDLETYLEGSFPWERTHLGSHVRLLAQARGDSDESVPASLRAG